MNTTEISWTHWPNTVGRAWNPTRGCSRVSPGCGGAKGVGGCYAERQAYRFSQPTARTPHPPYEGLVQLGKQGPRWTGKVDLVFDKLSDPIRWRGRSTVFVNSMSDLFHDALSDAEIDEVFGVMAVCEHHTFIVLTKREERMRAYLSTDRRGKWARAGAPRVEDGDTTFDAIAFGPTVLPNVVLGVSVENQEWADKRIPALLATPAACRMVSYEPALGPVDFTNIEIGDGWGIDALIPDAYVAGQAGTGAHLTQHPAIDWVVLGGESGPGSRHFDIGWARATVAACRTANVPVYVKQLGRLAVFDVSATALHRTHEDRRQIGLRATRLSLHDKKGADWSEWPEELRVRELPVISRRHERVALSMLYVEAEGSAEVVGAAIDMAMGMASTMRGAP